MSIKLLDNSSFQVLRTNPKLTTNVKLTVNENYQMFLNSFSVNSELSKTKYKNYPVNSNGNYEFDIYKFWNKGKTPNTLVYQNFEKEPYLSVKSAYSKQYDFTYTTGAYYIADLFYQEEFAFFAPLWLDDVIPENFVIFKLSNPVDNIPIEEWTNNILTNIQYLSPLNVLKNFNLTENDIYKDKEIVISPIKKYIIKAQSIKYFYETILKNSKVVKTYDLTEKSEIGKYIRKYKNNVEFDKDCIDIDWDNKRSYYNGISYTNGGFTKISENIFNDLTKIDKSIIEFDEFITNGFERNSVICSNLINLEFLFNDLEAQDFDINRYYGIYTNSILLGEFKAKNAFNVEGYNAFEIYDFKFHSERLFNKTQFINNTDFGDKSTFSILKTESGNLYSTKRDLSWDCESNSPSVIIDYKNINIEDFDSFSDSSTSIKSYRSVLPSYPHIKFEFLDTPKLNDYYVIGNDNIKTVTQTIIWNGTSFPTNNQFTAFENKNILRIESVLIQNQSFEQYYSTKNYSYNYSVGDFKNEFSDISWSLGDKIKITAVYLENTNILYPVKFYSNTINVENINLTWLGNEIHSFQSLEQKYVTFINSIKVNNYTLIFNTDYTYDGNVNLVNGLKFTEVFKSTLTAGSVIEMELKTKDFAFAGTYKFNSFSINGNVNEIAKAFSDAINGFKDTKFKSIYKEKRCYVFSKINGEFYNSLVIKRNENELVKRNVSLNSSDLQLSNNVIKWEQKYYYKESKVYTNNGKLQIWKCVVDVSSVLEPSDFNSDWINISDELFYNFIGGSSTTKNTVAVLKDYKDFFIDDKNIFIKTKNNVSSITNVSEYFSEPIFDSKNEIIDFNNLEKYISIFVPIEEEILLNSNFDASFYRKKSISFGFLSLFPIKDFDMDYFSNYYYNEAKDEYDKFWNKDDLNTVFDPLYNNNINSDKTRLYGNDIKSYFGLTNLLGFDDPSTFELDEINSEYERLKENQSKGLTTKSRVSPYISKWVKRSKNVKEKDARLNNSEAFGLDNFSPSPYIKLQNPQYFTHEWYYLSTYSNYNNTNISLAKLYRYFETDFFDGETLLNLNKQVTTLFSQHYDFYTTKYGYFMKPVEDDGNYYDLNFNVVTNILYLNELNSIAIPNLKLYDEFGLAFLDYDYFTNYFTVEKYPNDVYKTDIRYSRFEDGNSNVFSHCYFRGAKFYIKERKENVIEVNSNTQNLEYIKNTKYNGWKFSSVCQPIYEELIITLDNITTDIDLYFTNFVNNVDSFTIEKSNDTIDFTGRPKFSVKIIENEKFKNVVMVIQPKIIKQTFLNSNSDVVFEMNPIFDTVSLYSQKSLGVRFLDNTIILNPIEKTSYSFTPISGSIIFNNNLGNNTYETDFSHVTVTFSNLLEDVNVLETGKYGQIYCFDVNNNLKYILDNIIVLSKTSIKIGSIYDSTLTLTSSTPSTFELKYQYTFYYKGGGYNYLKNLYEKCSFSNIFNLVNGGSNNVQYVTIPKMQNSLPIYNKFTIEFEEPQLVNKNIYLGNRPDSNTPDNLKFQGLINYEIYDQSTKSVLPIFRQGNSYIPKFKDIFIYSEKENYKTYNDSIVEFKMENSILSFEIPVTGLTSVVSNTVIRYCLNIQNSAFLTLTYDDFNAGVVSSGTLSNLLKNKLETLPGFSCVISTNLEVSIDLTFKKQLESLGLTFNTIDNILYVNSENVTFTNVVYNSNPFLITLNFNDITNTENYLNFIELLDLDFENYKNVNLYLNTDIENFGLVNNLFYHKTNPENYQNILIVKNEKGFIPEYSLIDEISIDKKDFYIYSGNWDVDYYRKHLTKNTIERKFGSQGIKEDKSFFASKIMSIPENFNIEIFNSISKDLLTTIDDMLINEFYISTSTINSNEIFDVYLEKRMMGRLIELGADKEFKKYLSNDLTQGLTLDDYVKYYLKINVLSRFAVQEISLWVNNKRNSTNFVKYEFNLNDSEKVQTGYVKAKNYTINKKRNSEFDFEISFTPDVVNYQFTSYSMSIILMKK